MARGVRIKDHGFYGQDHVFFLKVFGRQVCATVTMDPGAVRRWIYRIIYHHQFLYYTGRLVVGLGLQWRSDPRIGGRERVATIQLCVGSRCLIFQIIHAGRVPRILERFLSNPDVTFVNVAIAYDCRKLWEEYQLQVATAVDLWKRTPTGRMSMQEMVSKFLGWEMEEDELKPIAVARSNWEAEWLDQAQVRYACLDVFCSFLLELRFREIYDP
ncbi:3'-5' exonuclease-like [Wolffia australiana]